MKRILSLLLVLTILCTMFVLPAFAASTSDVSLVQINNRTMANSNISTALTDDGVKFTSNQTALGNKVLVYSGTVNIPAIATENQLTTELEMLRFTLKHPTTSATATMQ